MTLNRQRAEREPNMATGGETTDGASEDPIPLPGLEEMEYSDDLRNGGWLGIDDDTLIVMDDGDGVAIGFDDVIEVTFQDIDRFVGVLSVVLVAFGIWGTTKNMLAGLAFALAGCVSLYLTYRKRNRLTVFVDGRPKPIQLYPANAEATYAAVTDGLSEV